MVQRCGVGGAQEEEQYLVCSSTKRALALKTQQALTSQHSGEDRCRRRRRRWRREFCVAAGPRSDVRLGDSSWRFRPRAGVLSSMRSTACPRQTLHHARSVASS